MVAFKDSKNIFVSLDKKKFNTLMQILINLEEFNDVSNDARKLRDKINKFSRLSDDKTRINIYFYPSEASLLIRLFLNGEIDAKQDYFEIIKEDILEKEN